MVKAKESVFLNVPYDRQFSRLYLAYITALSAMGFVQEATLGITGNRRLDRIAGLIERCEYSIHDLSRVQLDLNPPRTPRFNMPFELWPSPGRMNIQNTSGSFSNRDAAASTSL
jgi:hypothetical protein